MGSFFPYKRYYTLPQIEMQGKFVLWEKIADGEKKNAARMAFPAHYGIYP
jgi:hypothetical protein